MRRAILAWCLVAWAVPAAAQVTVNGQNPQLPAELGPNGGLKVECIAGTCTGSGGVGAAVDISSVGGNVVTTTVPVSGTVTFSNATIGVTGTFWQSTQPVSHANFANLDAALSTLANQATLALIKAKTDNLDVLLSTRTKPADQQHVLVDSATIAVTQSGTWNIGSITTLPAITGTVTANAGSNLNTSLLALEAGGNLAAIKTDVDKIPSQGQAAMASSTPVVIASNQSAVPVTGTVTAALSAGSAVIGHVITDTGSTTAVSNGAIAGTAGSPSTDVITVQGASNATALLVYERPSPFVLPPCNPVRRINCSR